MIEVGTCEGGEEGGAAGADGEVLDPGCLGEFVDEFCGEESGGWGEESGDDGEGGEETHGDVAFVCPMKCVGEERDLIGSLCFL